MIIEFQGLDAQGRPAVAMIFLGCLGWIDGKVALCKGTQALQQDGACLDPVSWHCC
jgi:hypothetical protein